MDPASNQSYNATYRNHQVQLDGPAEWAEGTRLVVTPAQSPAEGGVSAGRVIVVGFGLVGRCVADLLDQSGLPYTIVERNSAAVATQRALGRRIVEGDISQVETMVQAGLSSATILALTIPDEDAVLRATSLARRLQPDIYIIARTNYSSKGMQASQLGADDVVKAEQAVALHFYDRLSRRIGAGPTD